MKMKRYISVLTCFFLVAAIFAGCKTEEESIDFIYPFSGNINSYDPQVASTSDEYLIAENCFEGLVRCDDEGNITPGCASSWQIDDNGLKYTFHLQKGLYWHIFDSVKSRMGENYNPEITANDFVFALQRAADSATASPLYPTISCIENAPEINSEGLDKSELGIRAVDDYTLEIYLSTADNGFLQTLSTAVAMPCNREFFEKTNGRYGLDLKYTMFNGQFVLTNELEESYILKKNKSYTGPSPAAAADLTLKIVDKETELAPNLISGYYDAAYLRGYETADIGKKSGISLTPYSNIAWVLIINSTKGILTEQNARNAFISALSEIDYEKFTYLSDAKGFVPLSCTANGKSYSEQAADISVSGDADSAVSLWKKAVKSASVYSTEITVLAPKTMEDAAKAILQGVQSSIGSISNVDDKKTEFTLKLETMSESELKVKVNSGEYDIALFPFEATAASPVSFLQMFNETNITSFNTTDFENALNEAQTASAEQLISACEKCESALADTYCYAPLFYESSYYAQAKGVTGVQFHPGSGRVSFVYATRKD